jgi:hypothetical protein
MNLFQSRVKEFILQEVEEILKSVELGQNLDKLNTLPLVRPNAYDSFIYVKKDENDKNYLCDQYNWIGKNSNKNRNHSVIKYYYEIKDPNGKCKQSLKEFKRHIYILRDPINKINSAVLIHYLGDHNIFNPISHSNSLSDKPFVRTAPSVLKNIKECVKNSNNKIVYDNLIRESRTELESKFEDLEPVLAPRNLNQIQNCKKIVLESRKISNDEIFSLLELAKSEFKDFILQITVHPDLSVIFGEPSVFKLANSILRYCNENTELEQLISCDTTFCLGDFYLSVLVMRNIFIEGDPIFPVLFMVHERKFKTLHINFWRNFALDLLEFEKYSSFIPICTDREQGIVNAILESYPDCNLVFCQNHLIRGVPYDSLTHDSLTPRFTDKSKISV